MWNGAATLRKKIATGSLVKGFGITLSDPSISEMAGYAGFDYVFLDMEHTPLQNKDLLRHLVAARSSGCATLVRVCENSPERLKPILDMGPDGIIFPFIHSGAVAAAAIAGCYYPDSAVPGVRGQGPGRAVCYGFGSEAAYLAHPEEYLLKAMLIESWEGYKNLDEILATPGVDAVYVGMGDMSRSLAAHGVDQSPQSIYTDICKRTLGAGKLLGAPLLSSEAYHAGCKNGVQWGTCGIDTMALATGMRAGLQYDREEK